MPRAKKQPTKPIDPVTHQPVTFDLADIIDTEPTEPTLPPADQTTQANTDHDLGAFFEQSLKHNGDLGNPIFYDIETGPQPEARLRELYHEPTWEEFSANCDQRWKDDTKRAKFEEAKATGWQKFCDKAALSPITGRILLIGTLIDGKPWPIDYDDEAKSLESWWRLADAMLANKRLLIGHNSNAFDLPFLVRRSWALGVAVPREIRQGRYWHPLFRDTMEGWNCGAKDYVSLDTLGKFFGAGTKTEGVGGGDFARLWAGTPADRAKALAYNLRDLELTAAIAAKMGML